MNADNSHQTASAGKALCMGSFISIVQSDVKLVLEENVSALI